MIRIRKIEPPHPPCLGTLDSWDVCTCASSIWSSSLNQCKIDACVWACKIPGDTAILLRSVWLPSNAAQVLFALSRMQAGEKAWGCVGVPQYKMGESSCRSAFSAGLCSSLQSPSSFAKLNSQSFQNSGIWLKSYGDPDYGLGHTT